MSDFPNSATSGRDHDACVFIGCSDRLDDQRRPGALPGRSIDLTKAFTPVSCITLAAT